MTDLSTSCNLESVPSFTVIRYELIDDVTGLSSPGDGSGGRPERSSTASG